MKIALEPIRGNDGNKIVGAEIDLIPNERWEYPLLEQFISDAKTSDYIKIASPKFFTVTMMADALIPLRMNDGVICRAKIKVLDEEIGILVNEVKREEFIKISSTFAYIEARGIEVGVNC